MLRIQRGAIAALLVILGGCFGTDVSRLSCEVATDCGANGDCIDGLCFAAGEIEGGVDAGPDDTGDPDAAPIPDAPIPDPEPARWTELGGSATAGGISNAENDIGYGRLAVDSQDRPHTAWMDVQGNGNDIYYRHWNGNAWVGLGGSDTADGISNNGFRNVPGSLIVDGDDQAGVVWEVDRGDGTFSVHYREWDGQAWSELGASATDNGISIAETEARDPIAARYGNQGPVVAWKSTGVLDTVNTVLHLRQFNGQEWVELAGSATLAGISGDFADAANPRVAVGADNSIFVAWDDARSGNKNIYLVQWTGDKWVGLGDSDTGTGVSASDANAKDASIVLDDRGFPIVTYEVGGSIHLKSWDGVAWVELGGSATDNGISGDANGAEHSFVAMTSGGDPVVAWEYDEGTHHNIYVTAWDGVAWKDLSGDPQGISTTVVQSEQPEIRLAPLSGDLYVSWEEEPTDGDEEVYLKTLPAAGVTQ